MRGKVRGNSQFRMKRLLIALSRDLVRCTCTRAREHACTRASRSPGDCITDMWPRESRRLLRFRFSDRRFMIIISLSRARALVIIDILVVREFARNEISAITRDATRPVT